MATLDRRFGQMIENKALAREPCYEFCGYGKMLAVNQDVVGQIELFQDRNAAHEIRSQHKTIVRLTLYDVANADQLRISSQHFQFRPNHWRPQIDPADHSQNRRGTRSQIEKPASFFQRLACLNRDRSTEARVFQL